MMYSKEQLQGFIGYTRTQCDGSLGRCYLEDVADCLAQQCLAEMESREAIESKIAIQEYALRDMAGDIVWTRDCIDKCVSDYINGAEEALKEVQE